MLLCCLAMSETAQWHSVDLGVVQGRDSFDSALLIPDRDERVSRVFDVLKTG